MSKEDNTPHVFKAHGDRKLAEFVRSVHYLWIPPGVSFKQATDVKSFAHISTELKVNDEIILRAEDDSFYARVLVRLVKGYDVVVTKLEYVELKAPSKVNVADDYEVKYVSNRYKWGFKRTGTNDWIMKEIETEEAAMSALNDHRKAIAA